MLKGVVVSCSCSAGSDSVLECHPLGLTNLALVYDYSLGTLQGCLVLCPTLEDFKHECYSDTIYRQAWFAWMINSLM